MLRALRILRHPPRDAQTRNRRPPRRAQGRDCARAAFGHRRPLVAPAAGPGHCFRLGLDAGARASAPARRRASARDLGPRRLARACRDHRRDRRGGSVGDAWARGRAAASHRNERAQGPRARFDRPRGRGPVKAFAALLDRLSYTPSRNDKLKLLAGYFADTPDPDRGYALAALTDGLFFRLPLRRILTDLIGSRVDPVLFDLSCDYVGDTAETITLIWPGGRAAAKSPWLATVAEPLEARVAAQLPALLAGWLDQLDATG